MAEEKEKPEGAEEPKKSKTVLIIVIVAIVLVLAVGGALAFLMLKGGEEEHAEDGGAPAAHAEKKHDDKKKSGHGDDLTMGPVFAIDNLVVNLISEGGARYVKLSVALELDAQELAPEMLAKKALATDIVITVVSGKTVEELMTLKGKEAVKTEIMEKINEKLKDGRVKNVYFTNFVVQ